MSIIFKNLNTHLETLLPLLTVEKWNRTHFSTRARKSKSLIAISAGTKFFEGGEREREREKERKRRREKEKEIK
jgi:hypothetical protein